MKIVDLFGVGVPVAAVAFKAIGELVKDGINGVLFQKPEDLAELLVKLCANETRRGEKGVIRGGEALKILKKGAMEETNIRWEDEWDRVARTLFDYQN